LEDNTWWWLIKFRGQHLVADHFVDNIWVDGTIIFGGQGQHLADDKFGA
jgi:hypothetical protein